ncbi:MAG TPA: hypothetical protein VF054_02835 [Micromonosporaceae bacterium]
MPSWPGTAVVVASLLLAAWALVATVRKRPPDRAQLIGVAVVELLAVGYVATAIVEMAGGARPSALAVYIGYLFAFVLIPALAAVLARLEPSRWGSLIVMIAGLVMSVLVVRLHQVWTGG